MEQMELALKLDPHNPTNLVTYSHDLLFVQRYDEVISVSRELFDKNPTMFVALDPLFQALHLTGRYEEAFEVMKNCYTNMYKDFDHVFDQYDKLGYAGTLSLEGDTLLSQSRTKYIVPLDIAYFYIFAGNKEKALECLEQAYELHDPNMPYITRPTYAILRDEPRFQDLLRKLNLTFNY
jgi:tetratricopeptide (TPR) repeat protein